MVEMIACCGYVQTRFAISKNPQPQHLRQDRVQPGEIGTEAVQPGKETSSDTSQQLPILLFSAFKS